MKKILITGTAGFIGFHLVNKLLNETDWQIVGLDNINDYYDINLKYARLKETGIERVKIEETEKQSFNYALIQSCKFSKYRFIKLDLTDKENLLKLFEKENFDYMVNLAAQAGVRYSITNPESYIQSNIVGFTNVLEVCRKYKIKHLVYASSSSVYGLNTKMPLSTSDNVDHPISLYAATKRSNELMAHTYSYLYNLHTTGLRFFTVYGPWGRPDMALFKFTNALLENKPIDVYNHGNMIRDFTYIDDIVEGIFKVIEHIPTGIDKSAEMDASVSIAPYKLYNIGNSSPVSLKDFIEAIEDELHIKAIKNYLPIQPGDVSGTHSDVSDLEKNIHYKPSINYKQGIKKFITWYKNFYN